VDQRCVILAAGPVADAAALLPWLYGGDTFVAADGGMRLAARLNVPLSAVIADFDSAARADTPAGVPVVILPAEKDQTDTEAAVQWGLDAGFTDFLLLGATGGRLDHTLGNIGLLYTLTRKRCRAALADEHGVIRMLLPGEHLIDRIEGHHLSLLSYGGDVTGIVLGGVKYPLRAETLPLGSVRGVSNEFMAPQASLHFETGALLIAVVKD